MLKELYVKNVALIDELRLEFCEGLNVLTGETGAGKSIIIDAITLALGGKVPPAKEIIRTGSDSAFAELVFEPRGEALLRELAEIGIETEPGDVLVLSRSLSADGRGVCRINGRTTALAALRDAAERLIDICGQHQHQSLLNPSRHLALLDMFCDEAKLSALKSALAEKLAARGEILARINELSGANDDADRESKLELYAYQVSELEAAKLRPGEEDELNERKKNLNNFEKLFSSANKALDLLYADGAALDGIKRAAGLARTIAAIDENQEWLTEKLEEAADAADAAADGLRGFIDGLDSDPDEIDKIEARLDVIYNLKRKYGARTDAELAERLARIKANLDGLINAGAELERLKTELAAAEGEAAALCEGLNGLRRAAAGEIKSRISAALADLGMKNVEFGVEICRRGSFSADGYDKIEFLISANPGEPMKPLAKIASGGEMSRIMLALKNVLADSDSIETFIFDEIDAGVSGRAAQKVAEKLSALSASRQLLCVSHLPQIAAMADAHYLIEKESAGGKTFTTAHKLEYAEIMPELARLISGAKITESSLAAAGEMKRLADAMKRG